MWAFTAETYGSAVFEMSFVNTSLPFAVRATGINTPQAYTIAYRMGYISATELEMLAAPLAKNGYGKYLFGILRDRVF